MMSVRDFYIHATHWRTDDVPEDREDLAKLRENLGAEYDEEIRLQREIAWNEGYVAGIREEREFWTKNPYRRTE